jgi:hypothetical protein
VESPRLVLDPDHVAIERLPRRSSLGAPRRLSGKTSARRWIDESFK